MRRGGVHLRADRVFEDHQVAIAHARIEPDAVIGQLLIQVGDQALGLLLTDVAGSKILHPIIHEGDQVAPIHEIVRPQVDPACGRLERGSPRVATSRVITDHAQRGDIAGRREARRHRPRRALPTVQGDPVHVGLLRRRQGRATAQFRDRFVGRTVR